MRRHCLTWDMKKNDNYRNGTIPETACCAISVLWGYYMICKNCGGTYEETQELCPYCGAENEKRARMVQREYVEQKRDLVDEVQSTVAKKKAKRISNYVAGICFLAVVVFLVYAAGTWAISKKQSEQALEQQMKKINALESYYQNEEFDQMAEYIRENRIYGVSYGKYTEIADLYTAYKRNKPDLEMCRERLYIYGKVEPEEIVWDMICALNEMHQIDEMRKKDFVYGNEEEAMEIWDLYMTKMKEIFLFTEEEIEEVLSGFEMDKDKNMKTAELAAGRMNETYRQEQKS